MTTKKNTVLHLERSTITIYKKCVRIVPANTSTSLQIPMTKLKLLKELEHFYTNLKLSLKSPKKRGLARWLLNTRKRFIHILEVKQNKELPGASGLVFKLVQYRTRPVSCAITKVYFSKRELDKLRAFLRA